MSALDFLRLSETIQVLDRISSAAAIPMAIHPVNDAIESLRTISKGSCAVCARIGRSPGGRDLCMSSRHEAEQRAFVLKRPAVFVCHLGLLGVSAALFVDGERRYMLTLGPFCPSEESRGFQEQVGIQLAGFLDESEEQPALDDIRIVPISAVIALAEWAAEDLRRLWTQYCSIQTSAEMSFPAPFAEHILPTPVPRSKRKRMNHDAAKGMAMALSAGDLAGFRETLRIAISDSQDGIGMRARTGEVLFAVLGHLQEMGTVRSPQPDQQLAALKGLVTAEGLDACVEVCASYFRKITQKVRLDPLEIADPLASVYHAVRERLPERVNMLEVADEIGLSEARLRDLLKTRLGLSFPKLVTGLRIERAKALLAETKLDIQEVARRVGIDDLSNFAKAFRAIEGMSPGEYRSSRIR